MSQETARAYWRFTVLWLITGSASGILCALALLSPETLSAHPILSYGRLVSAHRTMIVHGVLFAAIFASAYTLLPKLTQVYVVQKKKSLYLAWTGSGIVLLGVIHILFGQGSGREYSDFPTYLAYLFWFYLINMAIDIGTLLLRTRKVIPHPATGFLFAAAILPAIAYPFTIPGWWGDGLFNEIRVWIGWRTIFMGCMTVSAIGLGIWLLGRSRPVVKLPGGIFSLGVVLFIAFAPLTGVIHLLDAPMGAEIKALASFAAVLSTAGLLMIIRLMWHGSASSPTEFLYLTGFIGLTVAAIQGVAMVFPQIHTAFHFTSNTSAHAHLALGALICIFIAGGISAAPRLARRKLTNPRVVSSGAGWLVSGIFLVFIFQASAGVLQAGAFSKSLSTGDWLPMFRWLQSGVVLGGVMFLIGISIIGRVIFMTLKSPLPKPEIEIEMEPLSPVPAPNVVEVGEA